MSSGGLRLVLLCGAVGLACVVASDAEAQLKFDRGQNVAPVFEGWERNPDGTFNMVFGYMNRNYREMPHAPIGADNFFEPGPADRGQPTRFHVRRQQFVFRVQVPADWGDKDLVWTVTSNGRTDRANRVAVAGLGARRRRHQGQPRHGGQRLAGRQPVPVHRGRAGDRSDGHAAGHPDPHRARERRRDPGGRARSRRVRNVSRRSNGAGRGHTPSTRTSSTRSRPERPGWPSPGSTIAGRAG